jgi:hypothetical protein
MSCRPRPYVLALQSLQQRLKETSDRRAAWQAHSENRAFAGFARHRHVAAHQARELAGDGKAQAGAAETLRGRRIGLHELHGRVGTRFTELASGILIGFGPRQIIDRHHGKRPYTDNESFFIDEEVRAMVWRGSG